MGSRRAMWPKMATLSRPLLVHMPPVWGRGCRGAPMGRGGLHGDLGGRGEYGVKKRSECG